MTLELRPEVRTRSSNKRVMEVQVGRYRWDVGMVFSGDRKRLGHSSFTDGADVESEPRRETQLEEMEEGDYHPSPLL